MKDEEDENPTSACTSALQNWHKSRLEGIRSQPVMDVVVSNPANNAERVKKTGVTCLLTEARKGESDQKRKLEQLLHSLEQHSSMLGITQNPTSACTSALQNWHKSRLEGIRSQPVMDVVVSNPANNAERVKKTGVTCLLTEARKGESDQKRKLEQLLHSLEQHSSMLGITQVVDPSSIDTSPVVDTRFGQCPVGSFGSYQLSFTESNFTFVTLFDGFDCTEHCTANEFPAYPSFPLDDFCGSFQTPDNLTVNGTVNGTAEELDCWCYRGKQNGRENQRASKL